MPLNRNTYYLLLLAGVGFFHLWEIRVGSVPLLSSYLDDVCIIPLVAGAALRLQQYLTGAYHFTYKTKVIFMLWCYWCVVFEWLVPKLNSAYTADMADVAAYGAGACLFYFIDNKPRGAATR